MIAYALVATGIGKGDQSSGGDLEQFRDGGNLSRRAINRCHLVDSFPRLGRSRDLGSIAANSSKAGLHRPCCNLQWKGGISALNDVELVTEYGINTSFNPFDHLYLSYLSVNSQVIVPSRIRILTLRIPRCIPAQPPIALLR